MPLPPAHWLFAAATMSEDCRGFSISQWTRWAARPVFTAPRAARAHTRLPEAAQNADHARVLKSSGSSIRTLKERKAHGRHASSTASFSTRRRRHCRKRTSAGTGCRASRRSASDRAVSDSVTASSTTRKVRCAFIVYVRCAGVLGSAQLLRRRSRPIRFLLVLVRL